MWRLELSREFKREHEGERIKPPWMGITKYDFNRDVETLHLVPFNFLFACILNCYRFVRFAFYPFAWEKELYSAKTLGYTNALEHTAWRRNSIEQIKQAAYDDGYRDGQHKGFRDGIFWRTGMNIDDAEKN